MRPSFDFRNGTGRCPVCGRETTLKTCACPPRIDGGPVIPNMNLNLGVIASQLRQIHEYHSEEDPLSLAYGFPTEHIQYAAMVRTQHALLRWYGLSVETYTEILARRVKWSWITKHSDWLIPLEEEGERHGITH